jgi:protoporphyrinogen IX oxidase
MSYLYLKALHIIFIVTWFAGLFYMVRLFIYQTETQEKPEPERSILTKEYKRISKLLWFGITWPSAILTLIFGPLVLNSLGWTMATQPWMIAKLAFVFFLYVYQWVCHVKFRNLQKDVYKDSGYYLRVFNEIATVLLVATVFLVVLKNIVSLAWGMGGLIAFTGALMFAIRSYKKWREKTNSKD